MKSEINYLPFDFKKNKALIIGPELREENEKGFLTLEFQYRECLEEIYSRFSKYPLALNSLTEGIDFHNLIGSNYLFANYFASFSGEKLIDLFELEGILNFNPRAFSNLYTDLSELVLFSNKTNFKKNKFILEHLVKRIEDCGYEFDSEHPLVIPSPRIVVDNESFDKGYGLLLELGQDPYYENALIANKEMITLGGVENVLSSVNNGINRMSFMENELTIGPNLTQSCENGRIVVIGKN